LISAARTTTARSTVTHTIALNAHINLRFDLDEHAIGRNGAAGGETAVERTPSATPQEFGVNAAVIAEYLPTIDPDINRIPWLAVGGALAYELGPEVGFAWWDAWSSDGQKYKPREMRSQWRSIVKGAYGNSIDTLFKLHDENRPLTDEERATVDAVIEAVRRQPTRLLQSSADFVADYTPPDYLVDGLLQRRYVYSFTAPTGTGKTAIVLLIAACVALGLPLAGGEVVKGRVLYFAGENPDDVRSRWIKLCEVLNVDPRGMDVFFLAGTPPIFADKVRAQINAEAEKHGPFSLLIIDTSAAYFMGDDENGTQLAQHARNMRTFVNLPGGPTVLITCHPVKKPDMENLLPRGGGGFLNEVDGNLVGLKDSNELVTIDTHGKFRGPEFDPFSFKIIKSTSLKLVDTRGRLVWTVYAEPISDAEKSAMEQAGHAKTDDVLRVMKENPGKSLSELAELLGWRLNNGEPNKRAVHRQMEKLGKDKLVEIQRGCYELTKRGIEAVNRLGETPF
jgi:hypothetical protein